MQEKISQLAKQIEATLFYLAEPVRISALCKTLDAKKEDVVSALDELSKIYEGRGLALVQYDDAVSFITSPEMSETVQEIAKEEYESDLGRASLETLAIVAYLGPVSRKEIDYIRGVNSQYSLRALLLRGLIERKSKQSDERVLLYIVTIDALLHLGLKNMSELPEYDNIKRQLEVAGAEALEENLTQENG
jgi:segregation and condensation protein B